jgi:hypothetical protein
MCTRAVGKFDLSPQTWRTRVYSVTHVLIKKYKLYRKIPKRTHVQSIRNRNKVMLVCTRFYRVLRLVCHSQDHVVPGRCPSPVVPEGTLTPAFRSYMFPFVLHWEPKQNQSPKRCATFCASLITQCTKGGQSRRASGDALWEVTWERTMHQYFLFLIWRLLISVYPTPIDKLQLLFSPLYKMALKSR